MPKVYYKPFISILVSSLFLLGVVVSLESADTMSLDEKIALESKRLDNIKMEIAQREAEYKIKNQKERSIFEDLRKLNESEKELNQRLKVLQLKIKKNEGELEKLNKEMSELQSAIEKQKVVLANRYRGLYKLGRLSYSKILLSSKSYSDFIYRYKLLKLVSEEDRKIISNYYDYIRRLEEKSEGLKTINNQLVQLSENLYGTKEGLKEKKREKTELLLSIKREKKTALKVLNELKEYQKDLTKLLKYLNIHKSKVIRGEEERILYSHFGDFPTRKGKLSYPVDGKVVLGFGRVKHSKFNIYTQHNGIDFKADYGSDVKAVYGGTVVFAKWFKSYGNLVIIDHFGGYFTLYAHLSEIFVSQGALVEEGAVIGKVGDTGSLKGPILYFELRYKNNPLNAMKWFKRRRN